MLAILMILQSLSELYLKNNAIWDSYQITRRNEYSILKEMTVFSFVNNRIWEINVRNDWLFTDNKTLIRCFLFLGIETFVER